jgi:hypothetical protein
MKEKVFKHRPHTLPELKVFKHRPHALPELKERIIEAVNAIPREMCERAVQSFRDRLQQCVAANGRQLVDIIFKSE